MLKYKEKKLKLVVKNNLCNQIINSHNPNKTLNVMLLVTYLLSNEFLQIKYSFRFKKVHITNGTTPEKTIRGQFF